MDILFVLLLAVIGVAVVTALAQRLGVAGALLLVALGLAVGLLPFVHVPEIDPEIILVLILPPLLYAAAVRLPALEFRRDFIPISGLAVALVVITALVLGWFFTLVLPGVGFPLGIALGAILSPTDAVATSIAKRLGISTRVTTMLEGESLLNDATALVLLRTALIGVAAGSFPFGEAVGRFAWGVLIAVVVGIFLGAAMMRLRAWVHNSAASTAIGFTVPFLAYLPTEHLGGSGLVAAVVAGIVAGQGARRWFTPEQRMSDEVNWRTVELVLEGGIFLIMGLELEQIVTDVTARNEGIVLPTVVAIAALLIVVLVRALYVSGMVWVGVWRAHLPRRERMEQLDERLGQLDPSSIRGPGRSPQQKARRLDMLRVRVRRTLADLDYYQSAPLTWKHGTIIVWAGMRGVVTLAAAQTIPRSVEDRPVLVYIAFLVALVSLMLQGFTLPWLVGRLGLNRTVVRSVNRAQHKRLEAEMQKAAAAALKDPTLAHRDGTPFSPQLLAHAGMRYTQPPEASATANARDALELQLALIERMRARVLALGRGGTFSTRTLRRAQAELDANQMSLELRLRGDD